MSSATHAANCALVFGTPVTRSEFFDRAKDEKSDYMSVVLRGESPEKVWSEYYERLARAAESLVETAQQVGARVFRKATLFDFSYATNQCHQVVLLAHFRGATVTVADISKNWRHIVDRIEAVKDPILTVMRPAPSTVDELVEALNREIHQRSFLRFLPKELELAGTMSATLGKTLCRDLIDETFDDLITPGNRVELFDGLHKLGEIEAALADDFAGELDLTLCNSEALAVYLDLRRKNRIRHIHRGDLVDPLPQYLIVAETLRELAEDGGSYIETRLRIEEQL